MANKRISSLDPLSTPAVDDIIPVTDIDDLTGSPQGTTKKVTVANLLSGLQAEPTEGAFVDGDKTKLDGLNAADYATASHTHAIDELSDVDTSTVSPTPDDLLKWDGSNFVPGTVTVDVDTPLTTALRGTDNPHIGAFPQQSFKVTDNPYKSVMVLADADGNLEFVTKDGANVYVNTPSARLALAKGFSVQEDGSEPDIEVVTTDGTTYSVISGDSDTKGANGLPTRQGFNLPDIGAYPAPILISGGSIA